MSQTPVDDVERFKQVAYELFEVFSERGYRIDTACEADAAFGSGMARSALSRDLALDAISATASRQGLDFRPANGTGREFRCDSDGTDRRYRLRKAHRLTDGTYRIPASTALAEDTEDVLMLPLENWVFGYTTGADYTIEDVFIAPVVGFEEGAPGYYLLGHVTELLTAATPAGGFRPSDEDLGSGFEDDQDDEESGEFSS